MSEPVVEILMATYNGEAYLRAQIDSILRQTEKRWRLTISDDGSTDATPAIIDDYVRQYPDKIRRVRAKSRFGSARDHFFWLMRQADSAWIAFSDQDDVWFEHKLERQMDAMRAAQARLGANTPILVFSDQTVTDERLSVIAPSLMRYQKQYAQEIDWRALVFQNVVTGGACLLSRALAELAGRCEDVSRIIMHDWWLAIVAARFGEIVYVDEPLGAYRQHGGNCVGAKDVGSAAYAVKGLRKLPEIRKAIEWKKNQAEVFDRTYRNELNRIDLDFLSRFQRPRSGILFYVRNRRQLHGAVRFIGMAILG